LRVCRKVYRGSKLFLMGMGWSIGQITLGTVARMCVDDFKGIKDSTARVKDF
jgi:hypothetical protein